MVAAPAVTAVDDDDITRTPPETVHAWLQAAKNGDVDALASLLKLQAVLSSAVRACFLSVPLRSVSLTSHVFFADLPAIPALVSLHHHGRHTPCIHNIHPPLIRRVRRDRN